MFGIAECGVLTALSIAPRFGVLAILPGSIARHRRCFAAMGVTDRLAGELAIDVGVVDLADEQLTFAVCRIAARLCATSTAPTSW